MKRRRRSTFGQEYDAFLDREIEKYVRSDDDDSNDDDDDDEGE